MPILPGSAAGAAALKYTYYVYVYVDVDVDVSKKMLRKRVLVTVSRWSSEDPPTDPGPRVHQSAAAAPSAEPGTRNRRGTEGSHPKSISPKDIKYG